MCPPIVMGVLTAGLGIAQAVMQHSAQSSAYKQNVNNTNKAFISEQNAAQKNQIGEQDAAADAKFKMEREATARVAQVENSASYSGVSGLSVSGLIDSIRFQEAERQQTASSNLETRLQELQSEKEASRNNYNARIASVQKPSGMALGLGIGSAVLSGATTYYQMATAAAKSGK